MSTQTPEQAVTQRAAQKSGILQAVSQLEMLLQFFGNAPERVQKAATEFRDALKEWADQ